MKRADTSRYTRLLIGVALFMCTLLALPAIAEDRALILGVGEYYKEDVNDLPGIGYDVDIMVNTAQLLGYSRDQIKVMTDEEVTFENVLASFKTWLIDGVSENDRVLLYYSGHGSRLRDGNGDETEDGKDEVLVFHEAGVYEVDGKKRLRGFLVDENLGTLLSYIPSKNVMVLIDACNSGTATRSLAIDPGLFGNSEVFPKYAYSDFDGLSADDALPGFAARGDVVSRDGSIDGQTTNYFAISAARDDESALATPKGSYFTVGISQAIQDALKNGTPITPEYLHQQSSAFIAKYVSAARVHHPQYTGSSSRYSTPIATASLDEGASQTEGTTWSSLVELSEQAASRFGALELATNKANYAIGDPVEITVGIPFEGYLNVITVDSKDGTTVLFPNRFHEDNKVAPGQFAIPTDQMNFILPASEPAGETLVVAFLSDKPSNAYKGQVGGKRKSDGTPAEDFAEVSHVSVGELKGIAVAERPPRQEQRQDRIFAAKIVVQTGD